MVVASTIDGDEWWPKAVGGAVIAVICVVATVFEHRA
jgi:hypothetical protein